MSTRLRRGIVRNDVLLVRRIVESNPTWTQNPDYDDKSNTSLHLAAKEGHVGIAEFLIAAGHEDAGISLNTDHETPLMLAAAHGRTEVGLLLLQLFPRCASWQDKDGMDALMLSAKHGSLPLLTPLLSAGDPPCSPDAQDNQGNTALHHASAEGHLKALRLLLLHGASPLALNAHSWTPIQYSATVAAEAYFKSLVAEFEKQKLELLQRERDWQAEKERQRAAGLRLVTGDDMDSLQEQIRRPFVPEFSPVEQKQRSLTPIAVKSEPWPGNFEQPPSARARASSGD